MTAELIIVLVPTSQFFTAPADVARGFGQIVAEALRHRRALREHHQRHPIARPQMIQRVARLHRNLVDIFLHAPADVQQQDQSHRLVAVRERHNRLRLALIGDGEIALAQILDQLVAVGHLDVHPHVRHAGLERRSGPTRSGWSKRSARASPSDRSASAARREALG